MLMTLFGGMSKGERARVQIRVKAAMNDLAERTDRFLGGRPPYGYRLADAGPHPNPGKAAAGQRLHRLEPDPQTAPVVERIYAMFGLQNAGLRLIAETLTAEGVPSPAAYDRLRNSHRDPTGWSHSAVRAILTNPSYRGVRVWGKQERFESLIDPDDVAAGHEVRMRWKDADSWITSPVRTHEPLVSDALIDVVAGRIAMRTPGKQKPRTSQHPYVLRGLIFCARCGSRLQGSYRPTKRAGGGRVLYRCEIRRGRALPARLADHPPTLYVNEAAILGPLDEWIASFADPAWLAESQTADPGATARTAGLRSQVSDLDAKISHLIAAIEAGGDPKLLAEQVSRRVAERDALRARQALQGANQLTEAQIAALMQELGGLAEALKEATPKERGAIYGALDLRLEYDDRTNQVRATSNLARVVEGVGGGT